MFALPGIERLKFAIFVCLTTFLGAAFIVPGIKALANPYSIEATSSNYLLDIIFGILQLIIAFLVARHKRLGLILGVIFYGGLLLSALSQFFIARKFDVSSAGGAVIVGAVFYFMISSLLLPSQKPHFT